MSEKPKRKRVVLPLIDKFKINKRLDEGESIKTLSEEYGVGKSTIADIKKQEQRINYFMSLLNSADGSTGEPTEPLNVVSKMSRRRHVVLCMKEKYEILRRLREGESAVNLAREYGVGKSTISDIKKHKERIINFLAQGDLDDLKPRKLRLGANTPLDDAVHEWLIEQRSKGETVSGPKIREKAEELHKKLGGTSNFVASTGWLIQFKTRYGICNIPASDDTTSAEESDPGHILPDNDAIEFVTIKPDLGIAIASASDSEREDEMTPTASEAASCLESAMQWFESQDECDEEQISVLRKVRDLARSKMHQEP